MKITLLVVGKTDVAWVKDGLDKYASRLSHYVQFSLKELPSPKGTSSLSREMVNQKEGALILSNLKSSDDVFLLDERGVQRGSVEFSKWLEGRMSSPGKDMVFVIGGPYGFSKEVYDRACGMVSLSKMTFSHQMVRVIFAEQLFRAFTIIKGEPYHHE